MAAIDPAARVAEGAIIEPNVSIGPFCAIGPDVVLREGVRLLAHVSITGHTTVGARTVAQLEQGLAAVTLARQLTPDKRAEITRLSDEA